MLYYPKKQPKRVTVISLLLYAGAIVLFLVSSFLYPRLVYQMGALVLVAIAIFFTSRYVLTDYKYVIKDAEKASDKISFTIIKVNGKREAVMANFDLIDAYALEKCKKISVFEKKHGKVNKFYGYTSNLSPADTYMLGIEFNGLKVLFAIEANDEFAKQIQSRIPKKSQNNEENNNTENIADN